MKQRHTEERTQQRTQGTQVMLLIVSCVFSFYFSFPSIRNFVAVAIRIRLLFLYCSLIKEFAYARVYSCDGDSVARRRTTIFFLLHSSCCSCSNKISNISSWYPSGEDDGILTSMFISSYRVTHYYYYHFTVRNTKRECLAMLSH